MYSVNSLIVYDLIGVCRVVAIGKINVKEIDNSKTYYTLKPLFQGSSLIMVPVDTSKFMRSVVSKENAEEVVNEILSCQPSVYYSSNVRDLTEYYTEQINTHNCFELLKLIKSIYLKNVQLEKRGKKLGQIDRRFMKLAEELAYGELSVALEISKADVTQYIRKHEETLKLRAM